MWERGWEYRRRRPEGTVLYAAVRDNLATLLGEHPELSDSAIEELLRYAIPVGQSSMRFARDDIEIPGPQDSEGKRGDAAAGLGEP